MHEKLAEGLIPLVTLKEEDREYVEFLVQVLDLFTDTRDELNGMKAPVGDGWQYKMILMSAIPQTYFTLLSLSQLAIRRLTEDASTCARKVFETVIHLMYLNTPETERDDKAKQFIGYGSLKNYKLMQQVKKHPDNYSEVIRNYFAEKQDQLIHNYNRDKVLFELNTKGEVSGEFFNSWTGKSLIRMIVEVNQSKSIVKYKSFCGSTHFSVEDIVRHIDVEKRVVGTGQNADDVPYLLHEAGRVGGQIIEFASNEFELDMNERLDKIVETSAKLDRELKERAEVV